MPRKALFSSEEIEVLFNIVEKYSDIIECKKTDCVSNKIKEDAREKIKIEYNATSTAASRETKDLKTKYKNVKYATKAKAAQSRRNIYGTGGGLETGDSALSGVEERMLDMMNAKELEGEENNYDCDTIVESVEENSDKIDVEIPKFGPSTLRSKINESLRTGAKRKETSWENLANIKSKWTERKLQAEIEKIELEMQLMLEKHEWEKEKHEKEIALLELRMQREKKL